MGGRGRERGHESEEGGRAHFLDSFLLEQGDVWVHSGDIDVNLSREGNMVLCLQEKKLW